ncbi:MAG: bis(5'-nucleosyl)-tetraphosphatase (symmetrical) YqeK [Oscillospiraceae bacterium]
MLTFQAVGEMLEPAVLERIQAQGLYGVNRDLRGLSMEGLEAEVVRLLDPKRVPHVLGCRDTAAKLAEQYGANPRDAARAGLLHDVTKALPPELQLQLCQEYGIALAPFSRDNPKTLHATTGAWVARKIFGENDGVFEAIASHTTGCGHMNSLQKILYIADYMEPNRDFPGVERLRAAVAEDLDRAVPDGLGDDRGHAPRPGSPGGPGFPGSHCIPPGRVHAAALACEKGMGGFPSAAGSPNLPKNE